MISLLVGLLLLGSPVAAALAVPFVFGLLLLIEGVALIRLGISRSLNKTGEFSSSRERLEART